MVGQGADKHPAVMEHLQAVRLWGFPAANAVSAFCPCSRSSAAQISASAAFETDLQMDPVDPHVHVVGVLQRAGVERARHRGHRSAVRGQCVQCSLSVLVGAERDWNVMVSGIGPL